jgi:CYTH domain-containing protein/predicted ATPase
MSQHKTSVIGLTGGPCAAKSTALAFLKQKLSDLGFAVITVPEAATELIQSGITPELLGVSNFQRVILPYILEKEERWKCAANLMPEDKKIVIICDRGVIDVAAYTSAHDFDLMLGEFGYNIVELRDKRYDGIVFLRSVAVDLPEVYTRINNTARKETIEEARALDGRTLEAWTGHPHIHIIDNSKSIEQKLHRVFHAVCRVLGIPAPLEIEQKFLVSQCDLTRMPHPAQQVQIDQYYLKSKNHGDTERIRARGQGGGYTYYHTVKRDLRPGVRTEIERQITRAEYFTLLRQADPAFGKIEKMRYCFVSENQYFELDVFKNPPGLIVLELELTEENDTISLPEFLRVHLTDVTDNPMYSNKEIARTIAQEK